MTTFQPDSFIVADVVPSPNVDVRADGRLPDLILLHYTGMQSGAAAIARLCDPAAEVSAHYTVDQDGTVHAHVPEHRRAWHAGAGQWRGAGDVNSRSIGIEIVNPGHEFGLAPFPEAQVAAVVALGLQIVARYGIPAGNVVAHADIAPDRKADPGELFPWAQLARAGLDSVALRVPAHPLAHAVLQAAGRPIAAPSANRSGRVSATSAAHVLADLDGRIDAVLDAGPTEIGIESTIVACLDGAPKLLRPGGVPRAAIEGVIGRPLALAGEAGTAPISPGLLASHYAPAARVRLEAQAPQPGEAWLGFGPDPAGTAQARALNLSPAGDLAEAAANLFGHLRRLDAAGPAAIAVAAIPEEGLGEAINDRLRRAAAPR